MSSRCREVFVCYEQCRKKFNNDKAKRWKQYKLTRDNRLMEKEPFMNNTVTFGFVVETIEERDRLIAQGHQHIVYTDRKGDRDDCDPVNGTGDFFQVSSGGLATTPNARRLSSYSLPCSCNVCQSSNGVCPYLGFCDKVEHVLKIKDKLVSFSDNELKTKDIKNDRKFTINQLKFELRQRNMSTTYRVRQDLVARLTEYIANL